MNFMKKLSLVLLAALSISQMPPVWGMDQPDQDNSWTVWKTIGTGFAALAAYKIRTAYNNFKVARNVRLHENVALQHALEQDKNYANHGFWGHKNLHHAVYKHNVCGLITLLAYGADPNVHATEWLEGQGVTPLISAVQRRNIDMVAVLVAAGAQARIPDDIGHDAHAYAAGDIENSTIADLLNDPVAARSHVVSHILNRDDLDVLPKTKEKMMLRMFDGKPMQSAMVAYMAHGAHDALNKQLVKNNWMFRHFGRSNTHKEKTRSELPKAVIAHIASFLDRDQLRNVEAEQILGQVKTAAQQRRHGAVAQRASRVLQNISLSSEHQ